MDALQAVVEYAAACRAAEALGAVPENRRDVGTVVEVEARYVAPRTRR